MRDRAEAPVAALLAQGLVEQRQDAARPLLVDGPGAQRVAGERGHRRGVRALALHVADQRRPGPAAGLEEVVEVAAELDALARGAEAHRGRQARNVRQAAGTQRALERLGDRPLALVELGVGDRHRGELCELGEHRLVALAELARGDVEHLEDPELAPAAGEPGARRAGSCSPSAGSAGEVAVSGRSRRSGAKIATVARLPRISEQAASAVSWRISSTVSEELSATEASASARSCSTCSCSIRATSCTSW